MDTQQRIRQRLRYLKHRGFIDHQTTQLEIKAAYLNNDLDIPRLTSMRIKFYISRGGGIYTTLRMEAVSLQTFARPMAYLMGLCFAGMLLVSTVIMSVKLAQAARMKIIKYHFT